MSLNRDQILNEVRTRMHDPEGVFTTTTQLQRWFNIVVKEIGRAYLWPFMVKTNNSLTLANGAQEFALPTDARGAMQVFYHENNRLVEIPWRPSDWLQANYASQTTSTPPQAWADGGYSQPDPALPPVRMVRIEPKADKTYTMSVRYVMEAPEVNDGLHVSPYPASFDEAIIKGLMRLYYRNIEDAGGLTDYDREFKREIEELKEGFKYENPGVFDRSFMEWPLLYRYDFDGGLGY